MMTDAFSAEQFCERCGRDTLALEKPVYDGFTKVGDQVVCATCGTPFEEEQLKAAGPVKPCIFGDDDRSPAVNVFDEGENRRLCRYCLHYIVNPFKQWCGLHRKEVEATDTCGRFAERKEKDEE